MRIGTERKRRIIVNYPIFGLPRPSSTVRSQSLCDNDHETLRQKQAENTENAMKRNAFRSLLFYGNALENCATIVQRLLIYLCFFFSVSGMCDAIVVLIVAT